MPTEDSSFMSLAQKVLLSSDWPNCVPLLYSLKIWFKDLTVKYLSAIIFLNLGLLFSLMIPYRNFSTLDTGRNILGFLLSAFESLPSTSPSRMLMIFDPIPSTCLLVSSFWRARTFFHPPTGTQCMSLLVRRFSLRNTFSTSIWASVSSTRRRKSGETVQYRSRIR